jgi:hypothetical protein
VHFGLATIHDLVDVTAGTKLGNDALSLLGLTQESS